MPQLTEAELKLQRKKEELKRKKEQRLKEQQAQAAKESGSSKVESVTAQTALEKAKAALLKKSAAAGKAPSPPEKQAQVSKAPANPLNAARQALEAQKKSSGGPKRPTHKRPTVQRVAKPIAEEETRAAAQVSPTEEQQPSPNHKRAAEEQPSPSSRAWDWEQQDTKRSRVEPPDDAHSRGAMIFVGDLPPTYSSEDLANFFSAYATVQSSSVVSGQCYGFVKVETPQIAKELIRRLKEKPPVVQGCTLRVNRAHDRNARQDAGARSQAAAPGVSRPALDRLGGRHPKVVEAKHYGDQLAEQLLRAGAHGLNFNVGPQPRELVTYDDL